MAIPESDYLPGPWSQDLPGGGAYMGGPTSVNLSMIPEADRERQRQMMMEELRRRMMGNQRWTSMMPQARPTDEQALAYQGGLHPPSSLMVSPPTVGGSVTPELPGRNYALNPVTQEEYEGIPRSPGPPVALKGKY